MMSNKRIALEFAAAIAVMGVIIYVLGSQLRPTLDAVYGLGQWSPLAVPLVMAPYLVFACRVSNEPVSMVAVVVSGAVMGWGALMDFSWSLFITGLIPFVPSVIIFRRALHVRHERRMAQHQGDAG